MMKPIVSIAVICFAMVRTVGGALQLVSKKESLRGHFESTSSSTNTTTSRKLGFSDFGLVGTQQGAVPSEYHSITDTETLGATNFDAAVGNALKGLLTSPRWVGANVTSNVPSTLEFYYIGLDEIMTGWNTFDWSVLDGTLKDASARKKHVIWRVYCDYPGQKLRIPQFLIQAGVKLVSISDGVSPQYDDATLLRAFEQFIAAFGQRYDGHKSIAFIQLGLLGKWGEWHTYPDRGLLSSTTEEKVVSWYSNAFKQTQLQIRSPRRSAFAAGIGLHDDSFAYSTVDGNANGGQNVSWFFWPKVKTSGETTFWKKGVMGGETRPELQNQIFKPEYAAGTAYKQDLMTCVKTTHASYLIHNAAFRNGGYSGIELSNALYAHARLGYNFRVNEITASQSSETQELVVGVRVEQIGVAPFYYPLDLMLSCDGYGGKAEGVEQLIEEGEENWFYFRKVPAVKTCLARLEVSLSSEFVYSERPVRFAQGQNGKVPFSLPLPKQGLRGKTQVPTMSPTSLTPTKTSATKAPILSPSRSTIAPATSPTKSPVASPTVSPTAEPSVSPAKTLVASKSFWEIIIAWLRTGGQSVNQ
jgi:hypothetical protein